AVVQTLEHSHVVDGSVRRGEGASPVRDPVNGAVNAGQTGRAGPGRALVDRAPELVAIAGPRGDIVGSWRHAEREDIGDEQTPACLTPGSPRGRGVNQSAPVGPRPTLG